MADANNFLHDTITYISVWTGDRKDTLTLDRALHWKVDALPIELAGPGRLLLTFSEREIC